MTNLQELFLPVKNYEGLYEVSNYGTIKSVQRIVTGKSKHGNPNSRILPERIKKQRIDKYGYPCIVLSKNGIKKHFTIHRLVCITFAPNPLNKPQINHIDGNKLNNHVSNLEWCTAIENVTHSVITGLKGTSKGKKRINKVQQPLRRKPVIQMSTNGDVINEYDSISDACKNGFTITHISRCCKGQAKVHKGYLWRFK
jgi:hypothetical protein